MTFKRILCGVDFSQESLEAFQVALETARLNSSSLYILHVIEAQPAVTDLSSIEGIGEVTLSIVEEAEAAMETLISSVRSSLKGIPYTTLVTSGRAFREILNYSQKWRTDLIVLGSKGLPFVEEAVLGTTTELVMKEANCSLLINKKTGNS